VQLELRDQRADADTLPEPLLVGQHVDPLDPGEHRTG
jgi:hypothetical protein